ncbi:LPS export ABC transporter periplasmic protein LptC [Halanaerobaculum tunisiense]
MRKAVIITVLILAFCIQPVAAEEMPFTIEADDHVAFVEAKQQIEAEGNVVIKLADGSIQADQMTIFLDKKVIVAAGNVTLIDGEQQVTGSKLEYNYQTKEGKLLDSQSQQDKLHFSGEVAHLQQDQIVVENSTLTTCLLDDPHYKLTAEQITVYPGDKVVARDVWLWAKDYKILPFPTYTASLAEDEEERKQETTSLPEPRVGYNGDDGTYLQVDYDHYINQDLKGKFSTKLTSRSTDELNLDYTYNPNQHTNFNPRLNYDREYGLDSYFNLTNQFDDTTSELKYNSYTITDEDDEDYRERKWWAKWDLSTKLGEIDLNTQLKQDQDDQHLNRRLELKETWSDYYWKLESSRYFDISYKPQLSVGVKNKDIGRGNLLSLDLKQGEIKAEANESEADVETTRKQLAVGLKNEYQLTETAKLRWQGEVTDASYGTTADYRSYEFKTAVSKKTPEWNFGLDYQYHGDQGQTPFEFDDLITDGLGARHLISSNVGQEEISLNDDLKLDWNMFGKKRFYEAGIEYSQYGLETTANYQIDEYNKLSIGYDYQSLSKKNIVPNKNYDLNDEDDREDAADDLDFISESDLTLTNQLKFGYQFQTNKQEFPYWDVKIDTAYDFKDKELAELNYSLTREFDCFNAQLEFDQLEKEVEWSLDFKY